MVLTQLCLALADLALQLPEWTTVVTDMIGQFGRDPAAVPALLQFLTVLAQETLNSRIRVLVRPLHSSPQRARAEPVGPCTE